MSTSTSIDVGGLFSHDEVYTFFSDTFPIFTEEFLTENTKNYLLEAVGYAIGANVDIPDEILKINKGIKGAAFLNRYYDYGKNNHPYGLPSLGNRYSSIVTTVDPAVAKSVIASHFGLLPENINTVSTVYWPFSSTSALNSYTNFILYLQHLIDYNSVSQLVDSTKTSTVLGINWGIDPAIINTYTFKLTSIIDTGMAGLTFTQMMAKTNTEFTLTFKVIDPLLNEITVTKIFTFSFSLIGTPTTVFYFSLVGDLTPYIFVYPESETWRTYSYPEIISSFEIVIEENTEFYPFLPIKVNGKAMDENFPDLTLYNGKTIYEHTKELAKTLNLDIDNLISGIKDGNPNYADTHSAYIFLGANFNSHNTAELTYLFDYFLGKDKSISEIIATDYTNKPIEILITEAGILNNPSNINPNYYRLFKTKGIETGVYIGDMTLSPITNTLGFGYAWQEDNYPILPRNDTPKPPTRLGKKLIREILTPDKIGSFRISVEYVLIKSKFYWDAANNKMIDTSIDLTTPPDTVRAYYVLDRQISATHWVRLKVINPQVLIYAGRDDQTEVYTKATIEELLETVGVGNELRIPLEKNRLESYTLLLQQDIATRSICIAVVLRNRDSVPWYKTETFAFFLKGVMMFIQIILLFLGIEGGEILQIIFSAIIGLAAPYILKAIFDFLAPLIGEDAAAVVTIAVAVVAIAYSKDMDTTQLAMTALNMTATVSNIYTQFTIEEIEELQKESALLDSRVEDLLDDIEKIKEGLMPGELSPFALGLLSKKGIVVETPTEFFFRTIHVGNPGVRTLNYPSTFVSNALQLPDLIKEDF